MALINCPECGTRVSDKAPNCPKCAFPINNNGISNTETKVENKEGCFLQTLNIGCLIIVGIIITIITFVVIAMFASMFA